MSLSFSHRQAAVHFLSLVVLSLGLLGAMLNIEKIQTVLSQATGQKADLYIDTQSTLGPLTAPWRSIAQGGESADYRLPFPQSSALLPEYIRLDHIFDMYSKVTLDSQGKIQIDFTQLDLLLNDIKAASATPFISLSYTPIVLAQDDVTSLPTDWMLWSELIIKTIEHISGVNGHNLTNVYYEVWNEPDLFGGFKTYGQKNYLTLYEYTARAAQNAKHVQPFYLGGPATTALYANWVTKLLDFVQQKDLRLDFYSWHLYSKEPKAYEDSLKKFTSLMNQYPNYINNVEPIISEWGITPEIHGSYDSDIAAAHLIAVSSILTKADIRKAFIFELQDGKDPQGKEYWGRWGLLTHADYNSQPKPRYHALTVLNRLGPEKILVTGEGSWVKAIASRTISNSISMVITNYDHRNANTELVPITFQNLQPGAHTLTLELLNRPPSIVPLTIPTTTYSTTLSLPANSILFLELIPQ